MIRQVALLRSVNVGGTGKLPMQDLRALCEKAGLHRVSTFIASGNALFDSDLPEREIVARLEKALLDHAGKAIAVMLRNAAEMAAIVAANPFPAVPGNRSLVLFLPAPPPADWLQRISGQAGERLIAVGREIYIDYGAIGMADTKLRLPEHKIGTGRNINSVSKLAALLAKA
jgi:uncharacterized protein (DUF1697 family)